MRARVVPLPADGSLPMLFALLLVACATQQALKQLPRSGDVAMSEVRPAGDQSYTVTTSTEQWDMPYPFEENLAPVYPPELLAANLPPMTVRVRVVVDEHGNVIDSTALEAPAEHPQVFAAVQAVVRSWKYWPLVKWLPVDGTQTDIEFNGWVRSYAGSATALPFHQDYDITFSQKDGKGVVTSAAPAAGN
jgi:TonB family protein